jgi:uncharacterized membrane protein
MKDLAHRVTIAFGFLLSAVLYSRLPGPFLTGPFLRIGPWSLAPRPLVAFVLPTAALVTYALLSRVWKREGTLPGSDSAHDATYRSISLVILLFITSLHTLLLVGMSGALWVRPWAGRGVIVVFGLLLIVAGNLLPRTRPNLAFGIRTRRTLADRALWIHVNRTGGSVAVAIGAVIVIAGTFLTKPAMAVVVHAAGLAGFIALLVSYRRHARA